MNEKSGRFASTRAVHVWYGRGPDELDEAALALLAEEELRLARSRRAPLNARYASAHAALRRILADHYLGGPPSAIGFGRHPCPRCGARTHGRPRIVAPATGLEFSLSRSGPHWAVAVTAGERVGLDIESPGGPDVDGAAEVALSEHELALLRTAEHADARREFFLRAWTRKEAVLKAVGVGIVADLRAVDVRLDQAGPVLVEHAEGGAAPEKWMVGELPLDDGLFAALAREAGNDGPVVLRPMGRAEKGMVTA